VKVLYLIDGLSVGGGAERSLLELAPGLRDAGVDLSVAYFEERPESAAPQLRALGVPVHHLAATGRLRRIGAVRRLLADGRFDVLHTTLFEADVGGRVAAAGRSVKVISSYVNTAYDLGRDRNPAVPAWKLRAVQEADGFTARHLMDLAHANSESVKASIVRHLRIPPERVRVVLRSRSTDRVAGPDPARRAEVRAALGLTTGAPVLVTVGRNEPQKNQDSLVRAMVDVHGERPDAVLLVAGRSGATTATLAASIDELGLADSVRLLGHRDDVPDLLQAADVFVLPTLFEGLPGSVIEAMAMGTPIVASDIGPVRELVDETTAVLVATPDAPWLATGVLRVLADPGAATERAERALERYRTSFTGEQVLAGMVGLYAEVMARG
jgi:glycosyltransferase involved in cell wall biosynthesis